MNSVVIYRSLLTHRGSSIVSGITWKCGSLAACSFLDRRWYTETLGHIYLTVSDIETEAAGLSKYP
jgi:hypothetical protein